MPEHKTLKLSYTTHRQQAVVRIDFAYDVELADLVKQFDQARWSQSMSAWYVPKEHFDLHQFFERFRGKAWVEYEGLKTKQPQSLPAQKKTRSYLHRNELIVPEGYLNLLEQKRYSSSTIKTYSAYFKDFMHAFSGRQLENISVDEINDYILFLVKSEKISVSEQNQRINSIKFFYEKVLDNDKLLFSINRPRKERKLPDVLSKEEIQLLLKTAENPKHKALIGLIYSCGLRRNEARMMKITDIDSKRMLIKIEGAKGKKDRYVQLANSTLALLRDYYRASKPVYWLFEGRNGNQYSAESIFNVIRNTALRAGIKKRVYPHILRHSFATHYLEQGTDLRYIQEWLGHESSKTTEIYTHVSKVDFNRFKNPLDDILDDG